LWTRRKNQIKAETRQFKAENRDNDVVTDDLAAKAYVEQFALDTLQRADNAVSANKASRYT
jgi:vacuolar protein sorting-associated protein VTA1